jgi:predicted PurR-regulated permease PerM
MNTKPTLSIRSIYFASLAMTFAMCLSTLKFGLLPGLLAICLGYLLTYGISNNTRLSTKVAAGIVIGLPLIALLLAAMNAKWMAFGAVAQYQSLLRHLAGTVLEIRAKLPPGIAVFLPDEISGAQKWLATYLQSQAGALTGAGTTGLHASLLVYVGLIVGALTVGTPVPTSKGELRLALRIRGKNFINAFRQIVVAQFWIASFNAFCTAIFLLIALPQFDVQIPYTWTLITLTFVAGLVPIVGNLLCNGVLTLAGVSVSPVVGVACLIFLITIHKAEYVINAKVVGKRTGTSTWELLIVMFVGESIFGVSGLVAAPLYYAYAKKELDDAGLI